MGDIEEKKVEELIAFDGSPIPTRALPKLTTTEGLLLQAMAALEPSHPPTMTCIYGEIGTGKSVSGLKLLMAVVPDDQYILYIHTASGYTTFNNHREFFARNSKGQRRIKIMEYENQEQLVALAKALHKPHPDSPFAKFGAVMFDEFSHMMQEDLQWVVQARVVQAEEADKFKDPYIPALPDYLAGKIRTGEVVTAFTKLKIHLMFIAHERIHDKTGRIVPDFGDKTYKDFFKVLHSVYYADNKKKEAGYVKELSLQPDRRFVAKNRIGGLGNTGTIEQVIEAYNVWGIFDEEHPVIKGTVVKESEPKSESKELSPEQLANLLN